MFKLALVGLLLVAVVGAVAVWLLPVEFFQAWNVARAGADPYAQFEAAGQAEALTWAARAGFPCLAIATLLALGRAARLESWLRDSIVGLSSATALPRASGAGSSRWKTIALRAFVAVWLVLFGEHLVQGVFDRGRDWAYFRFNSGADVLPNMSFENRAVIRYLREATPEDARILLCSDQRIDFISYYLLPRRVFHRVHPDAEFVIPQPGQTRPLAAYRYRDLTAADIEPIAPDFVVEYFEGADYVERNRLAEDPRWVRFWRTSTGESGLPPYLVSLRRYEPSAHAGSTEPSP